jgi:hypothetical protein
MVVASVELIVFAIQAGVKLLQTGRKVYVEATIGGDVVVPLPPVFAGMNSPLAKARNHAESLRDGAPAAKQRFKALYQKALAASFDGDAALAADGQWRLVQAYLADIAEGLVPAVHRGAAELASVAVLEQWEQGRSPFPSAVQRVAGTLVEIAIDYFVNVPGSLSTDSKRGKALQQFLSGLDDVQFADARWDSLVISLFTAALDTLADNTELVTGDGDEQSLLRTIVAGVAQDVGAKLAANEIGDLDAEARLAHFGQVVLRSLLRNAGTAVVASPSILGLEDGAGQAMVQSVGSAFLGLLLGDDDDSLGAGLRRVASTGGLDQLIQAALRAVVEHPDLFRTGNSTADKWLRGILTDLYDRAGAGESFFDAELFAAIATSAVDHGLRELPALLKPGASGSAVLVDIARVVFDRLTETVGGKPRWQGLQLSRSDVAALFDGVFASLAAHTTWFHRKGQLRHALEAAASTIPFVIEVVGALGDGSLKALLRSGKLAGVIAAVLASDALRAVAGAEEAARAARVVAGLNKVLDAVWKSGANGADRLLDENVLLDLLAALVASDVLDELFGDDAKATEVVGKLVPVLEDLRRGRVLTVAEMAVRLAA